MRGEYIQLICSCKKLMKFCMSCILEFFFISSYALSKYLRICFLYCSDENLIDLFNFNLILIVWIGIRTKIVKNLIFLMVFYNDLVLKLVSMYIIILFIIY